ncbi:methylated-DNA--[protein]-cysteine S-methyltransferase [Geoalkalibacter halelectricus]|uniref:Methylated-DNA--[protein]-cysteine S-methyltransferase n=2 Tax=Geoalkalibacter halelectricus TaxID=2847045 RepID=A0ABY5ZNL0_9BACT|nr:methylated-DNA--[protein]-cysteine S-methyltransferase [Geoalkalibacter halelectricus]MDO3380037.1 methylated-DNA--[protein]-cysteine S-methyltransferase [Geoalkalibacter halelectricus]UWZ80439.1 methylated-DNA--[protein]-cysteine S-methyltransferase [Geoalkalibacter halelectricus]
MASDKNHEGLVCQLISTPAGWLGLVAGLRGLREIQLYTASPLALEQIAARFPEAPEGWCEALVEARKQLLEYFAGTRRQFTLPLDWGAMSEFRRCVLQRLQLLPYAAVTTYGQLAREVGSPHGARAVGAAMAANPFVIVVPCHRVVGRGGRMVGYSGGGGVDSKKWLLNFEQEVAAAASLENFNNDAR